MRVGRGIGLVVGNEILCSLVNGESDDCASNSNSMDFV